jgi:NAD(P)-dependent dehydrogenase (short-subunit alcohol dehydrogenase family)
LSGIALVTGTSSGIGLSTAVQLAQAGFTVVATMRNTEKATPLQHAATAAGVSVEVRGLDVRHAASIANCVHDVVATHGRIDVLVNNAGSGFLGTLEDTSFEQLTDVMDVNFFGVWRVTEVVFPIMRRAASGRIITVSSVGGLIGQPFNDAYCAAKFAVEGMMESLAPVARRLGIHVSLIEPGPVNTEFVATVLDKRSRAETAAAGAVDPYASMRESYLSATEQAFAAVGQAGADVARVIVEAATAELPHLRYTTSELARTVVSRKYVDPTGDSVLALNGSRLG